MHTSDIVSMFLDFYRQRGHRLIGGNSLIPPPGDPVLFTTSGMHPLTSYLEGRVHPEGRRLMNVQRCLRTTDLDEVGDPWHLTVFEMLGTWSLGDYDGRRSLEWGYEFLIELLGFERSLLHTTVFAGDEQVPPDIESVEVWQDLGLPVELTRHDNWWSNGPTGPCGPDSEIFCWTGQGPPHGSPTTDSRWVEIWNHVTMRYHRHPDGSLTPLQQPNVDTGMGLERISSVLQGKSSVYGLDLFDDWSAEVRRLWLLDERTERLLCDHLRSSVVVIGEGVRPAITGRGYVLRRLLRRMLTALWKSDPRRTLGDLSLLSFSSTIEHFSLPIEATEVRRVILDEERRFDELVRRGRRLVARELSKGPLDDERLRVLHETHGLPKEIVLDLLVPALERS